MSNTTAPTGPILSFDGKRGKRVSWEAHDEALRGASITYRNSSIARTGLKETVVTIGYTADGRRFRTTARYDI
ncbi:hypothetical protein E3_1320 [Rhodococcus phage E3]|uniref:hypothetical protein n=1 Tax=Rhodococcus phage E3 TaxID=1007869 RepID=UPI0002C69C32|nr:hypothetical protein M176_gp140 [Rhodococcus phage E3]AEQ21048.1 hypothetical protein E3_1320 [Rhodococcus phage E3]